MLVISIDGACRRNGQPTCVSSGGVFIQEYSCHLELLRTYTKSRYEVSSTNQRGELLALLQALEEVLELSQPAQIITDSEYLFNTMTKGWYNSWESSGWRTAAGEAVKNSDIWSRIVDTYKDCEAFGIDVMFYHIKGHCIPFGKVTANTLLGKDSTGAALMREVYKKYDLSHATRKQQLEHANELSEKNNGFALPHDKLRLFVVSNIVADAVATRCVEAADSLL